MDRSQAIRNWAANYSRMALELFFFRQEKGAYKFIAEDVLNTSVFVAVWRLTNDARFTYQLKKRYIPRACVEDIDALTVKSETDEWWFECALFAY